MRRFSSGSTKCFFSWHGVEADRMEAEDICSSAGAALPTFKDGEEFEALMQLLREEASESIVCGKHVFEWGENVSRFHE